MEEDEELTDDFGNLAGFLSARTKSGSQSIFQQGRGYRNDVELTPKGNSHRPSRARNNLHHQGTNLGGGMIAAAGDGEIRPALRAGGNDERSIMNGGEVARDRVQSEHALLGGSSDGSRVSHNRGQFMMTAMGGAQNGTADYAGKRLWRGGCWREVLAGPRLNLLLVFVVLAFAPAGKAWTFTFSLLGIAPLAERLGFVTEQLAGHTNDTIGGLLNATFGNATEMIISIFALRGRLPRVVQLSLLGSILSNMLLVQGCAFVCGGLRKRGPLPFVISNARLGASMLLMAMTAISLPTVLHYTASERKENASTLFLSRTCSILMLIMYVFYITFLLTNDSSKIAEDRELGGVGGGEKEENSRDNPRLLLEGPGRRRNRRVKKKWRKGGGVLGSREWRVGGVTSRKEHSMVVPTSGSSGAATGLLETYDEESGRLCGAPRDAEASLSSSSEAPVLGVVDSLMWMTIITIFIALLSGCLVDAIQETSRQWNVPIAFISVIILPIVGNAAEHASAVMFAINEKVDLSISVALGSSVQIAIFVIPFCVVVGWMMGVPVDLNFQLFETATLVLSVLLVSYILQEGQADWLRGLVLLMCYVIAGASFYQHNDTWKAVNGEMDLHAAKRSL